MGTPVYQVQCAECGCIWEPPIHSPLWWKAHKRAQAGFLDARLATGVECGCDPGIDQPDAPFRVFGSTIEWGYTTHFDIPCRTFTEAVRTFKECRDSLSIVFIEGASPRVESRLTHGC